MSHEWACICLNPDGDNTQNKAKRNCCKRCGRDKRTAIREVRARERDGHVVRSEKHAMEATG